MPTAAARAHRAPAAADDDLIDRGDDDEGGNGEGKGGKGHGHVGTADGELGAAPRGAEGARDGKDAILHQVGEVVATTTFLLRNCNSDRPTAEK